MVLSDAEWSFQVFPRQHAMSVCRGRAPLLPAGAAPWSAVSDSLQFLADFLFILCSVKRRAGAAASTSHQCSKHAHALRPCHFQLQQSAVERSAHALCTSSRSQCMRPPRHHQRQPARVRSRAARAGGDVTTAAGAHARVGSTRNRDAAAQLQQVCLNLASGL